MAIDYVSLAATAKRLIDDSGRAVTLVALDYEAPNDEQFWLSKTNTRESPGRTLSVNATFVPLSSAVNLGMSALSDDMTKKATAVALVGSGEDLTQFQELIDSTDNSRSKIMIQKTLRPGATLLLSFLVLSQ